MLLDPVENGYLASWHRLQYDASISHGSNLAAGMTEYAHALTSGMWPSMDILPAEEIDNQGKRLNPVPLRVNLD
jgi:hypothetical protein